LAQAIWLKCKLLTAPFSWRWGLHPWHMAEELTVLFRTKTGEEEAKVFTQQPLGMDFQGNMPIVINRLRGKSQADQLGVQVGWEVLSINNIALTGQTFHDARDIVVKLAATLPGYMLVRKCPPYVKSTEQLSSKLKRVEEAEVMPFLQQFGFVALSADAWGEKAQRPELGLGVIDGHREKGNHTWYAIIGKVQVTSGTVSSTRRWQVERRLAHIRALLHDPVKRELGKEYDFHFNGAHFPHHGGPSGTTARMEAWLEALSRAIKTGELSPARVASILSFLEAPHLDEDAGQAISESVAASEKASVGGPTISAPFPLLPPLSKSQTSRRSNLRRIVQTTKPTLAQMMPLRRVTPVQTMPLRRVTLAQTMTLRRVTPAKTMALRRVPRRLQQRQLPFFDASSSRLTSSPAMEDSEDLSEAAI